MLKQEIAKKTEAIKAYINNDVPIVIGVEAVREFRQNFVDEAFDGEKWKDVQRRNPESPWYGHSGQTGRKSSSRATAKILDGETGELKNATTWDQRGKSVFIINDKPYAKVHNEGLPAKIYGKKEFTMTKRQFIGVTERLSERINEKIERDITRIINS